MHIISDVADDGVIAVRSSASLHALLTFNWLCCGFCMWIKIELPSQARCSVCLCFLIQCVDAIGIRIRI